MDMVQALFELQEMEGDLQKSKTDLAEVVSRLDHNEGVTKSRDRSARAKQAFTRLQMTQAELDVDVQATTARLKELDQRLYSGNTVASKDLLALQHEIKFTKEKQSDLEGKLLARQEQLEQHAKAIALAYQTAEAAVAPSDLKTYRVLQKSKGTAVAQVDRGLCSGCIIAIPSRELQMLRTATTPMRCSSCGRFLFIAG
jgi:predicted  nucleic acid-binding Zn-ribbon protein